ncbi:hypothetical protein FACS18942_05200 [Planctomycetales bacterium]|nr:hypothetical protein FACS18942_05200 [Planctomycetales bacterium]
MLFHTSIQMLVSDTFYSELLETLNELISKKRLIGSGSEQLLNRLYSKSELIKVNSVVLACRDADDNYLLALSKDGNADYLITRDKDLLVLKTFEKTKIVPLDEFEKLFSF